MAEPCYVRVSARVARCSVSGVDLGDEQPTQHEIGSRTYIVAQVEPLDVDGVRTTEVGTALWLLGFLGLLPFWGTLQDNGRTWWLWTCLAGLRARALRPGVLPPPPQGARRPAGRRMSLAFLPPAGS